MRASKETAAKAGRFLLDLQNGTSDGRSLTEHTRQKRVEFIAEFISAAQRKLPSEASYEREKKRDRTAK